MDIRVEVLEKLIIESVDLFLAEGGKLISGSFGSQNGTVIYACPLSTISFRDQKVSFAGLNCKKFLLLKTGLKYDYNEIWDFIFCFDKPEEMEIGDLPFRLLGKRLREKYDHLLSVPPLSDF